MGHVLEGGGGNFGQDYEGGTQSVDSEGETTNSGYHNFDPGRASTINWRSTGGQLPESRRSLRGNPISDPSHNPTGSSATPIPEESCKRLI